MLVQQQSSPSFERMQVIANLHRGGYFGEKSLLHHEVRAATVICEAGMPSMLHTWSANTAPFNLATRVYIQAIQQESHQHSI